MKYAPPFLLAMVAACGGGGTSGAGDAGMPDAWVPALDVAVDRTVGDVPAPRPVDSRPLRDAAVGMDARMPTDGGAPSGDAGANGDVAPSSSVWAMGYYAGFDVARLPVEEIAWAGLTHVAAAFYLPKADGTLDESFYQGGPEQGRALGRKLVDAAHAHGRKALASLGGGDSVTGFRAATTAARLDTFVASIVRLAADYGFDGIDFDWEPLSDGDVLTLTELATRVRAANPSLLLTVPVGWTNANQPPALPGYAALATVVDQLNVMSYGAAGAWSGWKSWHSSALYQTDPATPSSVDASVRAYLAAGVPRGKLGFGIGFYGLCYTFPITGPGQALSSTGTLGSGGGALPYAAIMASYYTPGARQWDGVAKVPYLRFAGATGAKGCGFISYDDEQSIAEKGAYLKAQGLGGVIIWEINQGHLATAPEGQRDPLLDAVGASVLGTIGP